MHLNDPVSYLVLGLVLAACLAIDVRRAKRSADLLAIGTALREYAAWSALGLVAAVPIAVLGSGPEGVQYLTAYVLEKTLSVDNVAVIAAVFSGFAVARERQPKLLQQGILGALALRIVFIAAGVALIERVHFALVGFGAILIITGARMLRQDEHHDPAPPRLPGGLGKGARAPLISIVIADVVFAVDSIPAAFGVTTQTFLIVAANAFAILGLRPTYILLAGGLDRFRHLATGVAVVLVLIGLKLALSDVGRVPDWLSLVSVAGILGGSVLLSLRTAPQPR